MALGHPYGLHELGPDSILFLENFGFADGEDVIIDGKIGTDDNRFTRVISITWQDSLKLIW